MTKVAVIILQGRKLRVQEAQGWEQPVELGPGVRVWSLSEGTG